jgi:pyrophosphatase PpaX
MTKLDAVLFDLDGTLVDSNALISAAYRQTFAIHYPELTLSDTDIMMMVGPPLREVFAKMNPDPDHIQAMINTYLASYRQMEFDVVTVYPHAIDTMKKLKNLGLKIGIVTTKYQASALPSIHHFGIDNYLDVLIGLDDVTRHKPDPEPIYKALERLNCHSAIMVGDNPSDILAGINAGIPTCAVAWAEKKTELLELHPDFWIDDFLELIEIIQTHFQEES